MNDPTLALSIDRPLAEALAELRFALAVLERMDLDAIARHVQDHPASAHRPSGPQGKGGHSDPTAARAIAAADAKNRHDEAAAFLAAVRFLTRAATKIKPFHDAHCVPLDAKLARARTVEPCSWCKTAGYLIDSKHRSTCDGFLNEPVALCGWHIDRTSRDKRRPTDEQVKWHHLGKSDRVRSA